jgi:hypothetical protein
MMRVVVPFRLLARTTPMMPITTTAPIAIHTQGMAVVVVVVVEPSVVVVLSVVVVAALALGDVAVPLVLEPAFVPLFVPLVAGPVVVVVVVPDVLVVCAVDKKSARDMRLRRRIARMVGLP